MRTPAKRQRNTSSYGAVLRSGSAGVRSFSSPQTAEMWPKPQKGIGKPAQIQETTRNGIIEPAWRERRARKHQTNVVKDDSKKAETKISERVRTGRRN